VTAVSLSVAPKALAVRPSFGEAVVVWLKIGLIGFGGPAGQIALMHRIVVDERRWIDEARFLHALNFCMLLPGPEAQQLAVYLGWMLHRTWGGLVAGILFVLPGALVMMALSIVYVVYREVPLVSGLLFGIKAAVLAIVIEATLRIGRKALKTRLQVAVAVAAFVAIFFLDAPFPVIVLAAAVLGYALGGGGTDVAPAAAEAKASAFRPSSLVATIVVGGVLWFAPTLAFALTLGPADTFTQIGLFFSKMAVVTFGGAYAVLSYVAQQAVETYGWLTPADMLAGLGLAETTPGPLILVLQFVAFLGAYADPGPFSPLTAAIIGGVLATWVTFVPCFIWIFAGAPYVERLRGVRRLSAALATITAAVVGVVLNLAIWFGIHVLFARVDEVAVGPIRLFVPELATIDPAACLLALGSLVAMLGFKVGMLPTVAGCAVLGAILHGFG
jgi:chromate transporter